MQVENKGEDQAEVSSGTVCFSKDDSFKKLIAHYEDYLKTCTALGRESISFHTRSVQQILVHMTGQELVRSLSGSAVCKMLREMDREEPPGFLQSKKETHSANYLRNVLQACKRLVDCLSVSTEENLAVDDEQKRDTEKVLLMMSSKFPFLLIILCACSYLLYHKK